MSARLRVVALGATAVVAAATFASCAELPDIQRDVCGNQVIDRENGEECDGFVPAELTQECRVARGQPVDGVDPCAASCAAAGDDAACQFVADGETTFCPIGYALGYDGVCRRPSGRFSGTALARFESFGLDGAITDFDGDGFSDLLITQGPQLSRVRYFKEDGTVFTEIPIPAFAAAAGFISDDFENDVAADLLIANGPAITTYRGAEGPSFIPKAYAPFLNPFADSILYAYPVAPSAVAALQTKLGFDLPLAAHNEANETVFEQVNVSDLSLGPGQARLPITTAAVGPAVLADVVVEGNVAVGALREPEVLLADGNAIWFDSVSRMSADATPIPALPGETIVGLFSILGADSLAAVVIDTGSDMAIRPIGRTTLLGPAPVLGPLEILPAAFSSPQPPTILALGYINGDEAIDIVTDRGVYFYLPVQIGESHYGEPFESGTEPWSRATIADIHGDGRNEVIALPASGNLAVLLPGTPFTMNPATISIPSPPESLSVSDFDGDGVGDILVITESGTQGAPGKEDCDNSDDLYLLFGKTAGLPDDPVLIGSLRGVWNAAPMRLFIDGIIDGIADIGVQTSCSVDGVDGDFVGVFFGSTTRIVSSPFSPYAQEFDREPFIERIATGQLAGSSAASAPDTHQDVVIVTTIGSRDDPTGPLIRWDREVRILPVIGDAEMVNIGEAVTLTSHSEFFPLVAHQPGLAVGPLFDGSAAEEIVVLSGTILPPTGVMGEVPMEHAVSVIERDPGAVPSVHTIPLSITTTAGDTLGRVRLLDFDGDGDLDVVAAVQAGPQVQMRLLLNDGASLSPPADFAVSGLLIPQVYDVGQMTPPTCTSFEPACDPERSILASGFGTTVGCPYADTSTCEVVIANELLNGTLVVGDLNGDGLDDIVTMTPTGTEIFAQCSQSDLAKGLCLEGAAVEPPRPPP